MKRLYLALAILILIFSGALYHTHFLSRVTGDLSARLRAAEPRVEDDDWEEARHLTDQAAALWEEHSLYFHVFLRHNDTGEVETLFREVHSALRQEDQEEYALTNARLQARLNLLREGERFILKNVL